MRRPIYEKLDYFADLLEKTVQCNLDPVTELYYSSTVTGTENRHAWIRDNLWAVQSVWALCLSYRKFGDTDDARAKFQMLAGSATKTMRSLLMCMMRQSGKIERFKKTKATEDAIHAKFNVRTLSTVVGDHDWGHLQLDATGLFVLQLAQMTASGLQIVLSLEEVDFIQNLVFYIESAYKTVDYGIWERGDKTNHGVPELNASSIGMCLAALEAIDGLDLFQCQGGYRSIIHVSPDEKARCQDVLESLLPRESKSKEVGAALLPVVLYPAFALSNADIVTKTLAVIDQKLQGRFGYIRFQRDGYCTPIEDTQRLHYDPLELEQFEKIECQWPLFLCMRLVSKCFQRGASKPQVDEEIEELEKQIQAVLLRDSQIEEDLPYLPMAYAIDKDSVAMERKNRGSAKRESVGFLPHIWGQSLYILSRLLVEDFVSPGELDPLNRRMAMQKRPEVIVQVSFLALDDLTQETFNEHGYHFQRAEDITTVRVHPVTVLSDLYKNLGKSEMLGLSGRPKGRIGVLSTSKFYELGDGTMTFFYPEFSNIDQNWIAADVNIFIEEVQTELNYIQSHWNHPGRPTIVIPLSSELIWNTSDSCVHSEIINLVRKITSGYIAGVHVKSAKLEEFLPTSNVSKLQFADVNDGLAPKTSPSKTLSLPKLPITPMRSPKDFHKARIINMHLDLTDMTLVPRVNRRRSESSTFTSTRSGRDDSYTILTAKCLVDQAGVLIEISEATDGNYRVQIPSVGPVQIGPLLEEVFDRACREQQWLLARELAGYLNKPLPGLDQAVTDILVRQKSITVGLPPDSRETTIDKPLQSGEIEAMILEACGDGDVAILQQEVILYLAMLIRGQPTLFNDLLRLRVGLIVQVLASELARLFNCSGQEASSCLLALPPSELKTLLHSLLSGHEIAIAQDGKKGIRARSNSRTRRGSIVSPFAERGRMLNEAHSSNRARSGDRLSRQDSTHQSLMLTLGGINSELVVEDPGQRAGSWLRRRQLDGALNRVATDFYSRVWQVLDRCHGLQIGGRLIQGTVTREMTSSELKFALLVENTLNGIPEPERRQMVVEALSVLSMLASFQTKVDVEWIIDVDVILSLAEQFFREDQTLEGIQSEASHEDFYDSAPTGRFGTMAYLVRACTEMLEKEAEQGESKHCAVQ